MFAVRLANASQWFLLPVSDLRQHERLLITTEIPTMTLKTDRWIRQMALDYGMIRPFSDKQVAKGVVSYGLSSCGYNEGCIVMLSCTGPTATSLGFLAENMLIL